MKKELLAAVGLLLMASCMTAQELRTLPQPKTDEVKMTLMDALRQRSSVREFDANRAVDDQTLANVLWAACGISRPESGEITAASAMNAQDIQVYVCTAQGAWLWQPKENALQKVCDKDLRPAIAARQESVAAAPVSLVLVSDQSKFGGRGPGESFGCMDVGYVSQNIYLACTAMGLKTVARAMMFKDELIEGLKLNEKQMLMLNHPIGY